MKTTCPRCKEPILDGQETEEASHIPRLGMTFTAHKGCQYVPVLFTQHAPMKNDRRVRYEDLNLRIVTNAANDVIWFEKAKKDALGEPVWQVVGEESRRSYPGIGIVELLSMFWTLLDGYTLKE